MTMALPDFSMRQLLEAGVHFGHQAHRWNPKMASYIFGTRNNIHIVDLAQSVPMLHRALQAVSDTVAHGGRILFVGTKRQAQDPVAEAAKRCAQYYVNSRGSAARWPTGRRSRARPAAAERCSSVRPVATPERGLDLPRERDKLDRSSAASGHGRSARPCVRDRYQKGRHRDWRHASSTYRGRDCHLIAVRMASASCCVATPAAISLCAICCKAAIDGNRGQGGRGVDTGCAAVAEEVTPRCRTRLQVLRVRAALT
jgi:small subunit ribosomal protein S2